MHELAAMRSVVSLCEEAAAREGFARVVEIRLKVGRFSGILPRCLEEYFPFAARDTVCEGARLVCESVPAAVACRDCGYEGAAEGWLCPRCGSAAIRLTAGREFFVDSLAVE